MMMTRQFANSYWQRAEMLLELEPLIAMLLTALQRSQKLFNAASSHDVTEEEKVRGSSRGQSAKQHAHNVLCEEGH